MRIVMGLLFVAAISGSHTGNLATVSTAGRELPVERVPGFYSAAEAYFSPDGRSLILNGRRTEQEADYHVYTIRLGGQHVQQVNGAGADACAYYFPSGERLIWTSTRDHLDLPMGNYSDPANYAIARYPDGNIIQYVSMVFECERLSGLLRMSAESTDIRYFPVDALPEDTLPGHRMRIEDALAGRAEAFIR